MIQRLEALFNDDRISYSMKYVVIFLILIATVMVTVNPISAQCAYDSNNPHVPCNTQEFLILDSGRTQIENIGGILYFVSESFPPVFVSESFPPVLSVEKIIFQNVTFSLPYITDPPRHVYSDVTFSDGTKETLSIIFYEPNFTKHVNPQAGLVGRTDGTHFLVSVNLEELPPLKQIQSGIPLNKIQCKDSLVLIQKYDGSPACVTEPTKTKLIERGWTEQSLPLCTSDRTACFNLEANICDPSGWDCGNGEVFSKTTSLPKPKQPSIAFPYIWNDFLLTKQGIEFEPKEQSYWNTGEGWYSGLNRVCSPIVTSNGTELYISSVFIAEPFEIIGTYIDNTKPDDCHKIWKTESVLPEPDEELEAWLEIHHNKN